MSHVKSIHACRAVKVSAFWAMLMCPLLMLFHVAELGDHFSYLIVFLERVHNALA
jgi:hypothetical protein